MAISGVWLHLGEIGEWVVGKFPELAVGITKVAISNHSLDASSGRVTTLRNQDPEGTSSLWQCQTASVEARPVNQHSLVGVRAFGSEKGDIDASWGRASWIAS